VVPNDKNHGLDSARRSFFDCILDQRFTGNREHLLGHSLGRWKHPSAKACCRDHCLQDFLAIGHKITIIERN
jgi:hypothetical protein